LYQQKVNEKLEDTHGIQDQQIEWNKIKNATAEWRKNHLARRREKEMKRKE